jgi:hypothetical protein
VNTFASKGHHLAPSDLTRPSRLVWEHINLTGAYHPANVSDCASDGAQLEAHRQRDRPPADNRLYDIADSIMILAHIIIFWNL